MRRIIISVFLFLLIAFCLPKSVFADIGILQLTSTPEEDDDWLQIGRDAQHSNYSETQVDPPYCYAWKWYEAPLASRAQPVVSDERLFIGAMNGILYARNASSGEPLWSYDCGSPIRNSPAVYKDMVIFTSQAGLSYALNAADGSLKWSYRSGASSTAPLIDQERGRIFLASSNGNFTSLSPEGKLYWITDLQNPILTTPALSLDGSIIYVGTEAIQAIALSAGTGDIIWETSLQGQSLADRYPVVTDEAVFFRSQPLAYFHDLLHRGDDLMDLAGDWNSSFDMEDWTSDWEKVHPLIMEYLEEYPQNQTFFALNPQTGVSLGTFPVLYTFGNNDNPNPPVMKDGQVYLTYRARHGIQTDSGTVHVSSRYDAELGSLNLETVDILPLTSNQPLTSSGILEWRMTSDEPYFLTMGGNILFVDNWERLGGLNVETGQNISISAVSNDWPECNVQCGPSARLTFFPLSAGEEAYPFPSPRVTEGQQRGGVIIANEMIYWRVIEGGIAAIQHQGSEGCPLPKVWVSDDEDLNTWTKTDSQNRPLIEYLDMDISTDSENLPRDVLDQLEKEVRTLVDGGQHWMPYYLERGFSSIKSWPYNSAKEERPPVLSYNLHGNLYWYDPGDLLITAGMAYPYLSAELQGQLEEYIGRELELFPPLEELPYGASGEKNWLSSGLARESYDVFMREELSNWPPVGISLNVIYGLWLWSDRMNDWDYVERNWERISEVFYHLTPVDHEAGKMDYFSDLAGVIGYYRIANHINDSGAVEAAKQISLEFMQDVISDPQSYLDRANEEYTDPRDQTTGWSAPALFGLTPEVGLFLREQTGDTVTNYLLKRETGNGLRWWYLTRAGKHAEIGETSFLAPNTAWSHFLGHAYLLGDSRETLITYLDRPWGKADLYSIQKLAAALQAEPEFAHFDLSLIKVNDPSPVSGEFLAFSIQLRNSGADLSGDLKIRIELDHVFRLNSQDWILLQDEGDHHGQIVEWTGAFPERGEKEVLLSVFVDSPDLEMKIAPVWITISSANLEQDYVYQMDVVLNNPFIQK